MGTMRWMGASVASVQLPPAAAAGVGEACVQLFCVRKQMATIKRRIQASPLAKGIADEGMFEF